MKFNFTPFPVLTSTRLKLRHLSVDDAADIFFLRADAEVNKYIDRPAPNHLDDARAFANKINEGIENGDHIYWAITQIDSDQMIGSICLWQFSDDRKTGETGYDLHPDFQGKGIMSEALKMVLNYGFNTLGLDKIEAFTHYANEASKQLLLKNHFILVPNKKDEYNANNLIFEVLRQ